MQVSGNTEIGRDNAPDVPDLFERLIDAGIAAWQVQITVPMGPAADEPELLLEPYQMIEIMPMPARPKARADTPAGVFWPGNHIGYFGPPEEHLPDTLPARPLGPC